MVNSMTFIEFVNQLLHKIVNSHDTFVIKKIEPNDKITDDSFKKWGTSEFDQIFINSTPVGVFYFYEDYPAHLEDNIKETEIKYYVNQTTDGGYSGDEFAGTLVIQFMDYTVWIYYEC